MSSICDTNEVEPKKDISTMLIAIYSDEDDTYDKMIKNCCENMLNMTIKEFELFNVGLSKLEWNKVHKEERLSVLSDYIIDMTMAFPSYGVTIMTSIFNSIGNGLDIDTIKDMDICYDINKILPNLVNSYRLKTIRAIMESNIYVKNSFKTIVSSSKWNHYQETYILMIYIANFLYLYDMMDMDHPYGRYYKELLVSVIFSILSSIDCELDQSYVNEKCSFMSALRQKNVSLKAVLNHKKHNLTSDQIEQLEFYNKLDILLNFVIRYFNQMLTDSPKKCAYFFPMIIRVFDSIIINSHNTIGVQYFWFYFCSCNKKILHQFLKHIWNNIFVSQKNSNIKRYFYVNYLIGLLSYSSAVSTRLCEIYLQKIDTYLQKYQKKYITTNHQMVIDHSVINESSLDIRKIHTKTINYDNWKSSDDIEYTRYLCHQLYYLLFQGLLTIIVNRYSFLCHYHHIKDHHSHATTTIDTNYVHNFIYFINHSLHIKDFVFFKPLNPLYYCDPIIADNFGRLTFKHKLFYCYHILQKNSRCWLHSPNSCNLVSIFLQKKCNTFNDLSKYFIYPRETSLNYPIFYNPFFVNYLPLIIDLIQPLHIQWKEIEPPKSSIDQYNQCLSHNNNIIHLKECEGDDNCNMFCALLQSNIQNFNDYDAAKEEDNKYIDDNCDIDNNSTRQLYRIVRNSINRS